MTRYAHLTTGGLKARLVAAESVCAMMGWAVARHDNDREKAVYILWLNWIDAGGNPERSAWPEWSDETIAELARLYDKRRQATLEGIQSA